MTDVTVLEPSSDALIVLAETDAFDVFAADTTAKIDGYLAQIRKRIDAFEPSLKTKKSRDEIKSMAAKVIKSKTYLEAIGKDLTAKQKLIPNKIDANRRHMKDKLDKWADEVRQPLTDWENAEESRVSGHMAAIGAVRALTAGAATVESIRERLAQANAVEITDACHEFASDYVAAKSETIATLTDMLAKQQKANADSAELEALRKEKADRDAAEAERHRIEKEAEAKRQSEAAAAAAIKAAAERAELEKTLAAERAKNAALAANLAAQQEAERKATESAQRASAEAAAKARFEALAAAEQAKREADTAHKAKINRAAVAAFVAGGIDETVAKAALKLIVTGKIPAVSISY
jgi:hypothetical protein